jgi:hypothetical protein
MLRMLQFMKRINNPYGQYDKLIKEKLKEADFPAAQPADFPAAQPRDRLRMDSRWDVA